VVSTFVTDSAQAISDSLGDRFGLDQIAREAVRLLFQHPGTATLSWLAVLISLLSAFSLARRLARAYAAIFDVPPLPRSKTWHGLVWIVLQVGLMIVASMLRDVRSGAGVGVAVLASVGLLVLWFGADVLALRLLVPAAPRRLVLASAALSSVGRALMGAWAFVYLSRSLENQANQFGPIGVTFGIFTYLLVAALVYLVAPLLVTTWVKWRTERASATT